MGDNKEDRIVVRDPADVRREQAARRSRWDHEVHGSWESQVERLADLLIKQGARNQASSDNGEFAARVDVPRFIDVDQRFCQQVEDLIRDKLGSDVDLTVKLFDTRNPWGRHDVVTDITMWASPKKP